MRRLEINRLAAIVLSATLLAGEWPAARGQNAESGPTSSAPAATNAAAARAHSGRTQRPDRTAGYKLEAGPYRVEQVDEFVLHDAKRKKDLSLLIRAPQGDDPSARWPLVIFSHGAGGDSQAFAELSRHWASHGYVVIHPTHSDSLRLRRRQGEDLSWLRTDRDRIRRNVDALDRHADVVLILDSLDAIEQRLSALRAPDSAGRIDRDRIGLAGHSAGAFTTQMAYGVKMGGRRFGGLGRARSFREERIKAAIVISGQGTTHRALNSESWSEVRGPMMVFSGSLDRSPISDETPQSRCEPFHRAPAGGKYLVYIEGATHGSYSGKQVTRLLRERPTTDIGVITDVVAAATLAFWDAHLRGDAAAKAYLASDGIERLSGSAAEFSRK